MNDSQVSTYEVHTADGLTLTLTNYRKAECDDAVLIIHGLTTSRDMFIMPEHENLVQYLLDRGFTDVWLFDFRMSNRLPYNTMRHSFGMDDIALYDYPPALALIREHIGDKRLHVICHCLGSVSFMMALFGGTISGISSVISNSVALTPRVPAWSFIKGLFAPVLMGKVLGIPYIDPKWPKEQGLTKGKVLSKIVSLVHRECDVPACHMLSVMWGTGCPALYLHENLHPITHERSDELYGATSWSYYYHVRKMLLHGGRAVKYWTADRRYDALPDDYTKHVERVRVPILFMSGAENHVFTDSAKRTYQLLTKRNAGVPYEYAEFPRYGHQDVFMGKNVAQDVFPRLLEFLDSQRQAAMARAASPVDAAHA